MKTLAIGVGHETMTVVDRPIGQPVEAKNEILDSLSKCLNTFGPRDV
jgi:hypothetical protein